MVLIPCACVGLAGPVGARELGDLNTWWPVILTPDGRISPAHSLVCLVGVPVAGPIGAHELGDLDAWRSDGLTDERLARFSIRWADRRALGSVLRSVELAGQSVSGDADASSLIALALSI